MHVARGFRIAGSEGLHQRANLRGKEIRCHADQAHGSNGQERQRERIIAAEDGKRFRQPRAEVADPLNAAACFLDRDNIPAADRESLNCFRSNIYPAAPGNIVEHERLRGGLRDRPKMPEQTFLARLVVIGSYDEHSIDAHFLRRLGRQDGGRGRVRSSPREDLAAPFCDLKSAPNYLLFLFMRKRGRFSRRAHGDKTGDSGGDLLLDQPFKSRQIEFALMEGRDQRGVGSFKHWNDFGPRIYTDETRIEYDGRPAATSMLIRVNLWRQIR